MVTTWILNIFWFSSSWKYNKIKLYKLSDLIQRYAQFWLFREGSGTSSSTTFWFFEKNVFHVIFKWLASFFASLSLLLEILDQVCIVIICFPVCAIIKFENNRSFRKYVRIKLFFYMAKKSRQKFKYHKNENNLQGKIIIFRGLSVAWKCLVSKSGPLTKFRF